MSPPSDWSEEPPSVYDLIRALGDQAQASASPPRGLRPVESLPADELAWRDREQDIHLKRTYAYWLLAAMVGQVALANGVFLAYAHFGVHWKLSVAVINVWLVGTLAEVIGLVLVVTRYLFPNRGYDS